MEAGDSSPPAEVSRVTVGFPPFWAERPAVWFAQAEEQFFMAGVNSEETKFFSVTSQLDHRYTTEVEDIITSPPERDPYTTLRTELVQQLSPSREQRIRQLLTLEEMGDRKPSQFPRHLRGLAPDVTEDLLYTIWSSRTPPSIQTILAGQQKCSLDVAARCADRKSEVAPQPALASVGPPPNTTLLQEIDDLSHQVAALSAEQDLLRTSFRDPPQLQGPWFQPRRPDPGLENRRPNSRSPSRGDTAPALCWYHRRFGARAQNCTAPCAFCQQRKSSQRTPPVAHVCSTTTGRLVIKDRSSKRQFLVDTRSDLCVYPRRFVPRRNEGANNDLCAANGTTIHTYGWLPLNLNLGLRRCFTWSFVVADVTHPIIGGDFLSQFDLLVDCRNNRILDGITLLSVPAQAANAFFPNVETITDGTPIDRILAEFSDLTRPAPVQREVCHNSVHHIWTTTGPPVNCRPRRLAPDRLAIAKAEFDSMLQDGIARRSDSSWSSALHIVPKKGNGWRP
jgi:hypothetical protein